MSIMEISRPAREPTRLPDQDIRPGPGGSGSDFPDPGSHATPSEDPTDMPSVVETFPNQFPDRDYEIEITCPEFTAVCPKTGQPDFGTIVIHYVPDAVCLELKSLKLYLFSYRDRGIFYEHSINTILDDLVKSCDPRKMKVVGHFNPRGGMTSRITAVYEASES